MSDEKGDTQMSAAPTPAPASGPPVRPGRRYLEHAGRSFVPVGAHLVPQAGPDWPWRAGVADFERELAAMAAAGLNSVRIDVIWSAVEPEPGVYDESHLEVLDRILAASARHGLWLHPALFVGGEVGDAVWEPTWVGGQNPHRDPRLLGLQVRHAAMLARRWSGDPSVIAWDLSDEPPSWLHTRTTTDDDARTWTRQLAAALRRSDPDHPVTIGTASQEVDHGPFRADVVADELDFTCVHPYPIYSPELYPDDLLSSRMTHAAAFEAAFASGAGRPVMVHEYGASSTQFDPGRVADYDRLLCWSAFGRGAIGFYAWCWVDAEPAAYARAPYVRMPHETQFGVTTHDGTPRPRLAVLSELAAALRTVDLDAFASDGPDIHAAVVVPHEYARPYDPASYGLDGASAGPYVPAERAWYPDRDVKPLVRACLNTFVLGARAGLSIGFPREQLDNTWPDTPLVVLPAPLTSTTSSLLHVRTSFWSGAAAFHAAGGTLYLSLSSESAIPNLDAVAGVRISGRAPVDDTVEFRFVAAFGGFGPGDVLTIAAGCGDPHMRGVLLTVEDAEVLAVDAAGRPVLTRVRRDQGWSVTCAHPIELLLAAIPDAHRADQWWRLALGLRELARIEPNVSVDHPDLTTGALRGPGGGLLVVTNHGPESVDVRVQLPDDVHVTAAAMSGVEFDGQDRRLRLQGRHAALLTWAKVTEID